MAEPYQFVLPIPQFMQRRRWRPELRVQPDRLLAEQRGHSCPTLPRYMPPLPPHKPPLWKGEKR